MSGSQINAEEEFVYKLYEEDRLYQIPKIQRPSLWMEENPINLVDELTDAYEKRSEAYGDLLSSNQKIDSPHIEAYKPYFQGSMSNFAITNELSELNIWTPKRLSARHKRLIKECIDLWIGPITTTESTVV